MPRPWRCHRLMFRRVTCLDGSFSSQFFQSRFTISMAIGEPMVLPCRTPDENMGLIRLDLHAPAAPITLLAPPKFAINEFEIDRHTGRQP